MLQSACSVCMKVHAADTLAALQKAVRNCCKKTKIVRPTPNFIPETFFSLTAPLEVTFERRVLSQNKTTYSHWTVYAQDKTDWIKHWVRQASPFRPWMLLKSEWELIDLRGPGDKEYDYGNLVGGAKNLADLLVSRYVIKDDAPKYFKCTYSSQKHSHSGTTLRLIRGNQ